MRRLPLELRQAISRLGRDKAFAVITTLTLAIGIGANTAVFSVVRAVILRPLPYADPARLAVIWGPDRSEATHLSLQEVVNYGAGSRLLSAVAGYLQTDANLTDGADPERIVEAIVTPNLFDVLGASAAIGVTPAGNGNVDTDIIVLADGLWRRRFGADPSIAGRRILVNGRPMTIVGVMPPRFLLPGDYHARRPTDAWIPAVINSAALGAWGDRSYTGIARLATGAAPDAASSELASIAAGWVNAGYVHAQPDGSLGALARRAIPVEEFVTGGVQRPLLLLAAAVGFVLLIACANVANLQLARAEIRQRELSLRAALGASRGQLVTQLLTESLLLAVAGGVTGLGVAWAGLRVLVALGPRSLPRLDAVALDGPILAFTALAALATGVVFGLVPALPLSRPDLPRLLAEGSRSTTTGLGRLWVRRGLVVLQLASSLVLALAAMLLIRSLIEMQRIELGFEPRGVLTGQVQLPAAAYPRPEDVVQGFRGIVERVSQIPGAAVAGGVRVLPLSRPIGDWSIVIEGRPHDPAENPNGDYQAVLPGYFEAMGIRPLRGRLLGPGDREGTQPVVVINETMAERYWPREDPIGRRFIMGTDAKPWLTIVGVIGQVRHNAVIETPRAEMYVAHAQLPEHIRSAPRSMTLVIKTTVDPASLAPALRNAVRAADPNLPVSDINAMSDVTAQAVAQPRFVTALLAVFAAAALLLAAVGIYGTVSLLVSERTREMGIRLALGAGPATVLVLVLGEGIRLIATGLFIGVVVAAALARLLSGLVYGVSVFDPLTLLFVPLALGGVALAASLLPARRAAATSPAVILK